MQLFNNNETHNSVHSFFPRRLLIEEFLIKQFITSPYFSYFYYNILIKFETIDITFSASLYL